VAGPRFGASFESDSGGFIAATCTDSIAGRLQNDRKRGQMPGVHFSFEIYPG
jgi:hypothetical protein